jgi:hypothetical protein
VTDSGHAGRATVRIEPAAREYIAARGGVVTLRESRRHGCCGGTAFVPVAALGRPEAPERFEAVPVDGVTVFVESGVTTGAEPLVVGIDGLWGWRRLRVDGTAIRM